MIARIAAIEKKDCSRTNGRYQAQSLFAFGAMNTDHRSGHGKASEHVIGRCDKTLGIMPFAFMVETTLGIELTAIFLCGGQVVLGAIDGNDRHCMPKIGWVPRPEFVGEIHGVMQDIAKNCPWKLLA